MGTIAATRLPRRVSTIRSLSSATRLTTSASSSRICPVEMLLMFFPPPKPGGRSPPYQAASALHYGSNGRVAPAMMRGNGAAVTVARHGVAGAIQATRATYERLRDRYLFQERG